MARKVYALKARQNSSSIILTGQTGNRVRYDFANGSVISNQPATFVTSNPYYQKLLEESEYVKRGVIFIKQVIEEAEPVKKPHLTPVEGVHQVKDALLWIAETFGEKVTTARQAIEYARKKGYSFPNLIKE